MKLKNYLLTGLSLVLVAAIAIGGTLAYLTQDVGEETNVFSVGNIDVSLKEEVGVFGEGGEVKQTEGGAEYIEVMPGDYLKKEVTVSNNGKTDAYVAVTVTLNNAREINKAIDVTYGDDEAQAIYDKVFDGWGLNHSKDLDGDGTDEAGMRLTITGSDMPGYVMQVDSVKTIDEYTNAYSGNWFENSSVVIKDGKFPGYYSSKMDTYEICYTYYMLLPAGESTTLFKGLNVPADFTNEQMAMFDGLQIDVKASAIQADNMAVATQYKKDPNGKAKTAFAILAGDIEVPEDYSNKPRGKMGIAYTSADGIWGEHNSNAKQSHVIKIYSGDTYMGSTSLNNVGGIINGDVTVTWNIKLDAASYSDEYWTMSWEKAPSVELQPTRAELWVDGEKVDDGEVQLNGPDNLWPIDGAVVDANGKILRYVVKGSTYELAEGESYVAFTSSADKLIEALENGEDVVLNNDIKIDPANMSNAYGKTGINVKNGQTIDGNGYTLDIKGAGGTWDSGINTTGGIIKNITVTGSFRGIFVNHNSTHSEPVVLENVIIDGTTYTISCDQGMNQTLTATGSTFKGWTSFAATLGEATFVDCYFGEGSGYAFCRPYAPTTFVGCDFEAGYEMDPRAAVTFEDCTIGGVALTADNLSTLVTSNIANASLK